MKKMVNAYFSFSAKEKKAIVVLLFLIGCFLAAPDFFPEPTQTSVRYPELAAYVRESESTAMAYRPTAAFPERLLPAGSDSGEPDYFFFDPNSIGEAGWRKLGLSEKIIRTLLHYREKGGRFRSASDIRKIWGMSGETADKLIPYIRIAETEARQKTTRRDTGFVKRRFIPSQPPGIDINLATAEEWESLPGIGEILARRILAFRKRLGGFQNREQVGRTYGLADSVFRRILPLLRIDISVSHTPLNLNTVSAGELQTATGISAVLANAIIAYRKQYGLFRRVEDIRKIVFINDSVFQQLKPFLQIPGTQ